MTTKESSLAYLVPKIKRGGTQQEAAYDDMWYKQHKILKCCYS